MGLVLFPNHVVRSKLSFQKWLWFSVLLKVFESPEGYQKVIIQGYCLFHSLLVATLVYHVVQRLFYLLQSSYHFHQQIVILYLLGWVALVYDLVCEDDSLPHSYDTIFLRFVL